MEYRSALRRGGQGYAVSERGGARCPPPETGLLTPGAAAALPRALTAV